MVKLVCFECGQTNRVPEDRLSAGPKCGTCGAALVEGKAREIDAETLSKAIRNDGMTLVVDFWAPWCGPCRMIAPLIDELASDYSGKIKAVKLNTDESPSVATEYGIRSIPTVMIFKGGRKMDTVIGAVPKSTLANTLDKYVD